MPEPPPTLIPTVDPTTLDLRALLLPSLLMLSFWHQRRNRERWRHIFCDLQRPQESPFVQAANRLIAAVRDQGLFGTAIVHHDQSLVTGIGDLRVAAKVLHDHVGVVSRDLWKAVMERVASGSELLARHLLSE